MAGHDGVHAGFDRRAEGHQFQTLQPFAVGGDLRQAQVAVYRGVAVSREMLGGGQNEVVLVGMRALDEGLHVGRHILRILAKRADVDDRVLGIVVDVGYRIVDPVDPQGAHFAFETGERRIARRSECHGMRKGRGAGNPHGCAPFEIGPHQQRHACEALHAIQKGRQRVGLRLLRAAAVGGVDQNEAAHVGVAN